jgi:hypothetical protein
VVSGGSPDHHRDVPWRKDARSGIFALSVVITFGETAGVLMCDQEIFIRISTSFSRICCYAIYKHLGGINLILTQVSVTRLCCEI